MALRYHLDENVHAAVGAALRRREIDVTTPAESDLIGASDKQHLAFAREMERILVTHDADFLRLHAQGVEHAGIAFCHARSRSLGEQIHTLSFMAAIMMPEQVANRVEYL